MIKPKKLSQGDKVAIVSLSSGILGENFCKHQLLLGIERLKNFGLEPIFMPNALKGIKFIKENPSFRAQDLKDAFYDDSIKAIICVIGGDDTFRILPYLMEDKTFLNKVKTHPKIFSGFSDTTNNHLFFYRLGLVTFYGINFLCDLAEMDKEMLPYTKDAFSSFFCNDEKTFIHSSPIWYLDRSDFSSNSLGKPRISNKENKGYEVLYGSGIIRGKLLGGCLESLYDVYTGSRYPEELQIYEKYKIIPSIKEWTGKIMFIETSEEKPTPMMFRTYLDELIKQGIIGVINGLMVGKPQDEFFYEEYKKELESLGNEYSLPIIYNVNFGHSYPRTVLPYGLECVIDLDCKTIMINESMLK